jgi:hypothetical protein
VDDINTGIAKNIIGISRKDDPLMMIDLKLILSLILFICFSILIFDICLMT